MEEKIFSPSGEWICPRCGKGAQGPKCASCRFCIYAGIVPRVLASVVDGVVVWSFARLFLFFRNESLSAFWVVTITGFFFYRLYHIFFVAKWGQTPGKMIAKIKVVRVDGAPAGWSHALLRNSVETLFAVMIYYLEFKAATLVSAPEFAAADFSKRASMIDALVPVLAVYISWTSRGYVLSEFVVMWMNRKKRAIHDFIGGTVVVHDPSMSFLPWKKKPVKALNTP